MQIFKDKQFITGSLYEDDERDYVEICDDCDDAIKIKKRWDFDVDWDKKEVKDLVKGEAALLYEAKEQLEADVLALKYSENYKDLKTEDLQKAIYYLLNKT